MSVQEIAFRAVCLALAALIALNTWLTWRRGERLRHELDETKRRAERLRSDRKEV